MLREDRPQSVRFSGPGRLIFQKSEEAIEFISYLRYMVEEVGSVSVKEALDYLGLPSNPNDEKYGWVQSSTFRAVNKMNTDGGYVIELSPEIEFD